jgi:hypothetical protein
MVVDRAVIMARYDSLPVNCLVRPFIILFLLCIPLFSKGQRDYPKTLFRNPLGIPIRLAGNFGECRPGHFHSGIDIKTDGKENLPVYAAASGYISRIKMEPGGFGHALYVTHPEGYTTLYAHLNDFTPALQKFIRSVQYFLERWEVDTNLPPGIFPVEKGQQIAWSGNTGGSTAPHLHFEIRDNETEHPLNPQLFGLTVTDNLPPVLKSVYVYDLSQSVYDASPVKLGIAGKGGTFRLSSGDTIRVPAGYVGIGLEVDDYSNGSENTLAPYTLEWKFGADAANKIVLDDIGYDVTRYLHAYADYRTKFQGGPWVQSLFRLPGNELKQIYSVAAGSGPLGHQGGARTAQEAIPVSVIVRDASGNESTLRFWLKGNAPAGPNTTCSKDWQPSRPNSYEDSHIRITAGEHTLYDRFCFAVNSTADNTAYSDRFTVGRPEVPVHTALQVAIKPNKLVPLALRGKLAMMISEGKSESGKAATPVGEGWYQASNRGFGTYRLVVDTTAPRIAPLGRLTGNLKGAPAIRFGITDAAAGVKRVRGEIDGKWVLFEQHGSIWTYRFDSHCPPGKHLLVLTATDALNNTSHYRVSFSR